MTASRYTLYTLLLLTSLVLCMIAVLVFINTETIIAQFSLSGGKIAIVYSVSLFFFILSPLPLIAFVPIKYTYILLALYGGYQLGHIDSYSLKIKELTQQHMQNEIGASYEIGA